MSIILFATGVILVIVITPLVICILPLWWLIAKLLGFFYPDNDYFPIQRIWTASKVWVSNKLGLDLEEIVGVAALVVFLSYAISGLNRLLNKE